MAQFDPSKAIAYSADFKNSGDVFVDDSLTDEEKKQVIAMMGSGRQPVAKFDPAQAVALDESQASPAPPMKLSDFTKERQRSAIQDPVFQKLKNAVIPTAAGAASMIPGVGPVVGAGIQATGTAANQVLGNEPYSLGEIAKSGAIGLAGGYLPKVLGAGYDALKGGVKAAAKYINPGATRTAGVEAGMQELGAVPNAIDRAYTPKASTAAFQTVRATADEVPTNVISRAVTSALNDLPRANAPEEAVKYLKGLHTTFDAEGSLPYADIHKQISTMYRRGKDLINNRNSESGQAILDARIKIIDELDKVSPALKAANLAYRREQAADKIAEVLSNPRPDVRLERLLNKDPLTKGVIPYQDAKLLEKIAGQIATMGTQASPYSGEPAKLMNLIRTPLAAAASSPAGMALIRQTFRDSKGNFNVTLPGLATVAQFGRAYMAQGGPEQP